MKKLIAVIVFSLAAVLVWDASAVMKPRPSHMDGSKNPEGCRGCHSGRGRKGTPLLKARREILCFKCHGALSRGRGRAATDMESVFAEVSRHPIETAVYHRKGERLPERFSTTPRHVSCADCHKTHITDSERPWRGARGYAPGKIRVTADKGVPPLGLSLKQASEEYELCYLCHSDSANLPSGARNKGEEFDPANASYHPVEMPGKNRYVPSLIRELSVTSVITCTSCHGNNDPSGPEGPHGSDYAPLLVAEYKTENGPEGPKVYELCYMCHDRRSILQNESFQRHNQHIVLYGGGTSCYTCHATHGSRLLENLMDFSEERVGDRVSSLTNGGGPDYIQQAHGRPRCTLNCHGVDHDAVDPNGAGGGKQWPW